jgi:putative transposase
MAQSLSNILLHVVFSTKHRRPLLDAAIEPELLACLAQTCNTLNCASHAIGAADDHLHLACSLSRGMTVNNLVQEIKQDSAKWIKTKDLRFADFAWQSGYGAFSIGHSQLDELRQYVGNQREHHRRLSFQDEYREILNRYEIKFDERYVWD